MPEPKRTATVQFDPYNFRYLMRYSDQEIVQTFAAEAYAYPDIAPILRQEGYEVTLK